MKLAPMSVRQQRVLAVALLLLSLALAYLLLVHWWLVAPQQRIAAQMDDLREVQSRYAAAISEAPLWRKRIAALGEGQAGRAAFLPEDDVNAAAAGLMQRVVDGTAAHPQGGSCEVTQKMPVANPPAADGEPYRKVAVSISLRCDMQPLAALLYTLEQSMPYLFVEDFSIYRNPVTTKAGGAAPLEVQFTLSGYVHQPRAAVDGNGGAS